MLTIHDISKLHIMQTQLCTFDLCDRVVRCHIQRSRRHFNPLSISTIDCQSNGLSLEDCSCMRSCQDPVEPDSTAQSWARSLVTSVLHCTLYLHVLRHPVSATRQSRIIISVAKTWAVSCEPKLGKAARAEPAVQNTLQVRRSRLDSRNPRFIRAEHSQWLQLRSRLAVAVRMGNIICRR
jgi:hypothetical protein